MALQQRTVVGLTLADSEFRYRIDDEGDGTVPLSSAQLAHGDKSKPIVVYCAAGKRAARAKETLEAAGYTNVVNGGGIVCDGSGMCVECAP